MSCNHTDSSVLEKQDERLRHDFEQRCDQAASERVAVIAGESTHTCPERDDRANQTARDLFDRGSKPGDRVRMVMTIIRVMGWLFLLATIVLSLAPPWYRPVPDIPFTDMPRAVEHFAIFLAAGLAFGLGYSASFLSQLIPLTLFTASVEIAQLFAPGRHARFGDFLIDVLGASVGLALGRGLVRLAGLRKSRWKRER